VALYRMYVLTDDDRIRAPPTIIDAVDETAAVEEASQLLDGKAIEVWNQYVWNLQSGRNQARFLSAQLPRREKSARSATGSVNSIRHVRSSVLAPIRRPTRRNAWRAAASVSKEWSINVNAPQRCEWYVLDAQSNSRNIGWSVINRNDFNPPKVSKPAPNTLVVELC
jgi:hypothetical protein